MEWGRELLEAYYIIVGTRSELNEFFSPRLVRGEIKSIITAITATTTTTTLIIVVVIIVTIPIVVVLLKRNLLIFGLIKTKTKQQ